MKISPRKLTCILCGLMVLLFCAPASAADLLPEDFVLEESFEPGYGPSVGRVVLVQGEVVILHAGEVHGYRAETDLPLYKGDTVVSLARGRIRISLNDQSVVTLASDTKLVITRSVYEPKKKIRSSFLRLTLGKALFWVKKLGNLRRSQVRVKSPTAVIGVRGTIFALDANSDRAIATSLEGTIWIEEVTPGGPQEVLGAGYQGEVKFNQPPTKIRLSIEELETIRQFFQMLFQEESGKPAEVAKGKGKKTTKVKALVVDPELGLVVEGYEESGEVIVVDREVTDILDNFIDLSGVERLNIREDVIKAQEVPGWPQDLPPPPE
jgi:hypothetical protein